MITIDQAIEEAQKNGRVCPQPQRWNELYELLPDRKRKGNGWEPSLPLILAAWWDTPILSKIIRFREPYDYMKFDDFLEFMDFKKDDDYALSQIDMVELFQAWLDYKDEPDFKENMIKYMRMIKN